MNKILILLAAILLTVGYSASASDVAEAAKKEKARREAIRKEGKPAKTFTNQDISELKSTLAIQPSTAEGEAAADPAAQPTEITTVPTVDPDLGQPAPQEPQAENNEEVEKLREEREALEQQAKDAQQTINQGGGYHTRNLGNQYKAKREAESRIREIDEELEKEKKEEEE